MGSNLKHLTFEILEDSANLPDPDIIAAEWSEWDKRHRRLSDEGRSERAWAANEFQIVEDLEAALSQFATIAADLKK